MIPKVSAVIITHNRLELVKKAYFSVVNQDYSNIEIIIVDDASTDGTKEYFESIDRKNTRYIYISPDQSKGGNYARNTGINESTGEYVALLDDDDEWKPTKTRKQVEYLQQNTSIKVVSCLRTFQYNYEKEYNESPALLPKTTDLHNSIFESIPYTTSCLMIERNALIESGCFDENLKYWQEYDLLIRLAQITRIGRINECLTLYRIINGDKHRLTNKLEGWEDAVKYVNTKYADKIELLSEESKRQRQLMIARDGAVRSDNCGNNKKKRQYLAAVVKIEPNIINIFKYIFGISKIRRNG